MNPNLVNPNQALWEKGDFTQIGAFMRQSGEAVRELALALGMFAGVPCHLAALKFPAVPGATLDAATLCLSGPFRAYASAP